MYDRQPQRLFEYQPILKFYSSYCYAMPQLDCPTLGVKVGVLSWGYGKERMTFSCQVYFIGWARRLSWTEAHHLHDQLGYSLACHQDHRGLRLG
jgi:hypothetical protein